MAHVFLIVCDFFSLAQQPLVGQGLLIIEASRSHTDTQVSRNSLDGPSVQRSVSDIRDLKARPDLDCSFTEKENVYSVSTWVNSTSA